MKVARQALPGKWNLTDESHQGRLNVVYYRRFVESAAYPYPEKQHAKKSSQKRKMFSKAVWAGPKERFRITRQFLPGYYQSAYRRFTLKKHAATTNID